MTLTIKQAITQVQVSGQMDATPEARRTIVRYAMAWVDQTWKNLDEEGNPDNRGKVHAVKGKVNLILTRKCQAKGFGKDERGWNTFRIFAAGLIPESTTPRGDADEFLAALDAAE